MYIYNAKLWWWFNWYFWCNMYVHSTSFVHKYICISICMCVHIILLLSWLFLFTFFSLLLCLPFIVSLFLLRAHIGDKIRQSSNTIYDTILILFVNLNYLSLLCWGSSSNAASHQRTKSLRTMPSIRFQSASKSAYTCSSRKNKKIHTNTHTHKSTTTTRATLTATLTHTHTYSHSRSYRERRLRNELPAPTQGPNYAIRWHHEAFAIIIDSRYRYLYTLVHKRQTDGQSEVTHRDKHTHTHDNMENSALSALVRAAGAFDSILFFAFYLLSERLKV